MTVEGQVVKNTSIDNASFADLFMGESVETSTLLDVAKIQMFFFTVLLVLAYAISVGRTLLTDPSLAALPDVGNGMLPLLGISHAGYLLSKTVTRPRRRPTSQELSLYVGHDRAAVLPGRLGERKSLTT